MLSFISGPFQFYFWTNLHLQDCNVTVLSQYYHHAVTTLSPHCHQLLSSYCHYTVITLSPCCHHTVTILSAWCHHTITTWSPCHHTVVSVTTITPQCHHIVNVKSPCCCHILFHILGLMIYPIYGGRVLIDNDCMCATKTNQTWITY